MWVIPIPTFVELLTKYDMLHSAKAIAQNQLTYVHNNIQFQRLCRKENRIKRSNLAFNRRQKTMRGVEHLGMLVKNKGMGSVASSIRESSEGVMSAAHQFFRKIMPSAGRYLSTSASSPDVSDSHPLDITAANTEEMILQMDDINKQRKRRHDTL